MKPKTYQINEIFFSIQGEGKRSGTVNVFVRFSGCNLKCAADDEFSGFNCDTEFTSGQPYNLEELIAAIRYIDKSDCKNVILTGGEPSLQIDQELIDRLKTEHYYIAIETNGMKSLPAGIDWVCVSPKSAAHTLHLLTADELKYVRSSGHGIPRPTISAKHYLISPAFDDHKLSRENLDHCIQLVKDHPTWELSIQLHNFLGVR